MKSKIKIKIQIRNRWSGDVLFECEKEDNTFNDTVVEAVKRCADLACADLKYANLTGAKLICADLEGANLRCANLAGADLKYADLRDADLKYADLIGADLIGTDLEGANLRGADLAGANLRCANLAGADLKYAGLIGTDLAGANLIGTDLEGADFGYFGKLKDILIIGTIGSRKSYTTCYKTDKGIFVKCGCFNGTSDEFVSMVKQKHNGNIHERDYLAMIEFVKVKFQ